MRAVDGTVDRRGFINQVPPNSAPSIALGAVLYTPDSTGRDVLARFAEALRLRGWRVGGLVQKTLLDESGVRLGVDAVAVDTGERVAIAGETTPGTCGLRVEALTESSAALRRAVAERVDLMVVEKFGEQEQEGGGLAADILHTISEGIPVLVAVPAAALGAWQRFTGGLGDLLPLDYEALWGWWGPGRLLPDLARGVPESGVRRVVLGRNWTLVTSEYGTGVARSPESDAAGAQRLADVGQLTQCSLRHLASQAMSWNPVARAVGVAAINAHYNGPDVEGSRENGLDVFAELAGPVTVIGRFPRLAERLAGCRVVEQNPRPDEFPALAGPALLAGSEAGVITASAMSNGTLPQLLGACRGVRVALVGPGTPLSPRAYDYGIEILSGLMIFDHDRAAVAVAEGGGVEALKACGRSVTVRRAIVA